MNILILGATSAIAQGSCKAFAEQGATLYLASRDVSELATVAADLTLRYGITVHFGYFDAQALASHREFFEQNLQLLRKIDGVLLAFGYLGQPDLYWDITEQQRILTSNFIGATSILSYCADYFTQTQQGFIIGISSVAGERSLRHNYSYDAAKSGLTTYLQGLRNRLFPHNIRVITVKPGFVDTPMTFGKKGMFWVADAEAVGRRIVKQLRKRQDILYVPWFWRYLMLIIRLLPESCVKRMRWWRSSN